MATKQFTARRNRFAGPTQTSGNAASVTLLSHEASDPVVQGEDKMAFTDCTIRAGKLLMATAFMLGMLTTASYAYSQQQQEMCTGDAMRLCGAYIPDVDRITACMASKHDQLSDGCKAVFEMPAAAPAPTASYSSPAKPAKPLNLTPNLKRG
jgi:hypothetical protein